MKRNSHMRSARDLQCSTKLFSSYASYVTNQTEKENQEQLVEVHQNTSTPSFGFDGNVIFIIS